MSVNENKIAIDFKGTFTQANLVSLMQDVLMDGLQEVLDGRTYKVQGKNVSPNHKQMTIAYSGPRLDQLELSRVFQRTVLSLPASAVAEASREPPTSMDTKTYTVQAYI